jgi:Family of unknown function (DUF6498)
MHAYKVITVGSRIFGILLQNAFPLLGVLYFGWRLDHLLIQYWGTTTIFGISYLLTLLFSGNKKIRSEFFFFLVHFGGFAAIHLLFLTQFCKQSLYPEFSNMDPFLYLGSVFGKILPALLAVALIELFQLFFTLRAKVTSEIAMRGCVNTYARVVVLHFVILIGISAYLSTKNTGVLILFIVLKTAIELLLSGISSKK